MESPHAAVRTRLSLMMFLQYFVWSAWGVAMGAYLPAALSYDGNLTAWIMATTALGAMIAPMFVGYIADRLFSTEKVLFVLHVVGGVCLLLAAKQDSFGPLMALMTINGLCYMPTLALTNSIAFSNIADSEKDFPIIRVWGTIGWIVAGLIVGVCLGEQSNNFLYLAGGAGIVMGLYCLTLPHTPPKGGESGGDVLGLRAIAMLRDPSFAVFVFCAFLVCVVLSFYWIGIGAFLLETDRPAPTALASLGQFSEIFFMASMPLFIAWLGLKRMLLVGILAWVLRYALFTQASFPLVLFGLVLHGVCYDFFFVAAYIYVDKKAPKDLRASAQSFITFVMLGVGMFVGMKAAGVVKEWCPPSGKIVAVNSEGEADEAARLPEWPMTEEYTGALRLLDLKSTIQGLLPSDEEAAAAQPEKISLAKVLGSDDDNQIAISQVEMLPGETITIDDVTYATGDLAIAFKEADADADGTVTRQEWRAAQAYDWSTYWLYPLVIALITGLIFLFGFHDNLKSTEEEPADDES